MVKDKLDNLVNAAINNILASTLSYCQGANI